MNGRLTKRAPLLAWAYPALEAAATLFIALPGGPRFRAPGFWVATIVLVAAGVLRGNRAAWWIAVILAGIDAIEMLFGLAGAWSGSVAFLFFVSLGELTVLFSPSVRRHVFMPHGGALPA